MPLNWWRNNLHRRSRFSPASGAQCDFLRKLKFTPRLERLEDRTLLADGVLDSAFGAAGLITTNLSYINSNLVYPGNSPAAKFASTPTHQNSLAIQTIGQVSKF